MRNHQHRGLITAVLVISFAITGLLSIPITHNSMFAAVNTPTAANSGTDPYTLFFIDSVGTASVIHYEIYTPGDPTAQELKPLTVLSDIDLTAINWSNAHQSFLLSGDKDTGSGLFVVSPNQPKVITPLLLDKFTENQIPRRAQWSPDGKNLAVLLGIDVHIPEYDYVAVYRPGVHLHTITGYTVLDASGQPTMTMTHYQQDTIPGVPQWSLDGKYIIYTLQHDIVTFAATPPSDQIPPPYSEGRIVNTDCLKQLDTVPCAIAKLTPVTPYDSWSDFQWLPDSQHLMFQCVRPNELATPQPHADKPNDLCTIKIDGSDLRHLYLTDYQGSYNANYAISPNGETLVYPSASGLNVYDMSAHRIVNQLTFGSTQFFVGSFVWIPSQVAKLLERKL